MTRSATALVCLSALALGGCGMGVFVQKDPMKDALGQFSPGTHTRDDIVALLGEPFVHLPERGVDVFQREGELTDVLLIPPMPYTTGWTYYTLISYDTAGILTGIDSGGAVYREDLRAGRFEYRMLPPGRLTEREERPAFATGGPGCALVMLVVGNRWSDALYFRNPISLNGTVLAERPDRESYVYVRSAAGPQTLSVTWGGSSGPWSASSDFDCGEGEVTYVVLADDRDGQPIAVGRQVPNELPGRALVLYPPFTDAPVLPVR